MSVTSVTKDLDQLPMTVTAEYDVSAERAWQLWADPRQLESRWGPPTFPATVEEHDLTPDGRVTYFMTGPEGEQHRGWWRVLDAEPPTRLVIIDGFADGNGEPLPDMPTVVMTVTLAPTDAGGTTMTMNSVFPTLEAMQQIIEMGMEEGLRAAMGQIDAILAAAS